MAGDRLRLVIVGAGGHGCAVAEAADLSGQWSEIVMVDDVYPQQLLAARWRIVGTPMSLVSLLAPNDQAIVAIGNQTIRERLIHELQTAGVMLATVVHPHAWVSADAVLSEGSVVMAGAIVGIHAHLGVGVIVNANATVDHNVVLGDFAHLGVGVQLAGGVVVQERAWLQAGVSAGYRVVVQADTVVPPGTALIAA